MGKKSKLKVLIDESSEKIKSLNHELASEIEFRNRLIEKEDGKKGNRGA